MAKHPVSPGFRFDLKWPDTPPPENTTWSLFECLAISCRTDLKWPDTRASSFGVSGHFVTTHLISVDTGHSEAHCVSGTHVSWFWVSDHSITPGLSPGSACLTISLHWGCLLVLGV